MSKTVNRNSLGHSFNVSGTPATASEYDEMAKATGACVDRAVDADFQHDYNSRWRAKFCEELEKLTNIARQTTTNDKGKEIYTEKEKAYVDRVVASTGKMYGELAQTVADAVPYKSAKLGGNLGETWLNEADKIINLVGDGSWDKFIENITTRNEGYVFDFEDDGTTPTRESVGLALKTDSARLAREEAAARLSMIQ